MRNALKICRHHLLVAALAVTPQYVGNNTRKEMKALSSEVIKTVQVGDVKTA